MNKTLTIILGDANRANGNLLRAAYVFAPDGSMLFQVNAHIRESVEKSTQLVLNYVGFHNDVKNGYIIKKRALVRKHIESIFGNTYRFVVRSETLHEYLKLHDHDVENIRAHKNFKVITVEYE